MRLNGNVKDEERERDKRELSCCFEDFLTFEVREGITHNLRVYEVEGKSFKWVGG